jgi:hypothetical protein
MLVFFLFVQNRLNRFPLYAVMLAGLVAYIAGHSLLLSIPYGYDAVVPLIFFTAVDACAAALFLPRRDSLVIFNVDPQERARIMALLLVIMLGVSSPFGFIIGLISEVNRRIPFMIGIGLFVVMGFLVGLERKKNAER